MEFIMKPLAALILLISIAAGNSNPYDPTITSPTTHSSQPSRFVYNQASQVNLLCSSTSSDVDLHWGPIVYMITNPLFPNIKLTSLTNEKKGLKPIQLNITYNPDQFVRLINVSCIANKTGQRPNTTYMAIEQLYPTHTVIINNGSRTLKVTPSEKSPTVELKCRGDGNPDHFQYRWYNSTTSNQLDVYIDTLRFPFKNDTDFSYQCQIRNGNFRWVSSQWVKVSGFDIIKPSWILIVFSFLCVFLGRS